MLNFLFPRNDWIFLYPKDCTLVQDISENIIVPYIEKFNGFRQCRLVLFLQQDDTCTWLAK